MTISHDLKLYIDARYTSPYAMSAFVALHEKGLTFETILVNLRANAQHDSSFAAMSLTQRVPTLVHGDFTLSESSAIAEYLDEVFPETRLYPTEPRARARARQIQAWLRSDLRLICQERSTEVLFYGPIDTPLSAEATHVAEKLFFAAELLIPQGEGNLFGDWSIADADLCLMLNRLVMNGDSVPERIASYAKKQWARPSIRRWVNQTRPPLSR